MDSAKIATKVKEGAPSERDCLVRASRLRRAGRAMDGAQRWRRSQGPLSAKANGGRGGRERRSTGSAAGAPGDKGVSPPFRLPIPARCGTDTVSNGGARSCSGGGGQASYQARSPARVQPIQPTGGAGRVLNARRAGANPAPSVSADLTNHAGELEAPPWTAG